MPGDPVSTATSYRRHEPEKGLWHKIVRENLLSLLEGAKDPDDPRSGIPSFVERELTDVLNCGVLSVGFIRWRCPSCRFERIVAFSCMARALCPSCGARRMFETAAHLVDRVFPDVPVRQFVLAPPWELVSLLAADPSLLAAMGRIFVKGVFRWLSVVAREQHGIRDGRSGAVVVVQRFTSSLGLFPHLHALVLDGVFQRADPSAAPSFHPARPPSADDERAISFGVAKRMIKLLERRGLLEPGGSDQPPTALMRWFARAWEERARLSVVNAGGEVQAAQWSFPRDGAQKESASTGLAMGFSVHARAQVREGDRAGRERLARYALRPPFCESQLSETSDGRIAFEVSGSKRQRRRHLVLEPVRLLRRLCWLIPPPRTHVVVYHGVLASGSSLRSEVVPKLVVKLSPATLPDVSLAPVQATTRLSWSKLLARVWSIDVETCPRCGAQPMRPIAAITEADVIRRILSHLGIPYERPVPRPARGPP